MLARFSALLEVCACAHDASPEAFWTMLATPAVFVILWARWRPQARGITP